MRSRPVSLLKSLIRTSYPLFAACGLAVQSARAAADTPEPIVVAEKLATKQGATAPAEGSIVFDGPPGDGRVGSKGILVKTNPALVTAGSTWKFRFTRGGTAYGLQIVHPLARGHAIAFLNKNSIALDTPKAWRDVGFGTSEDHRVTRTPGAAKIFPLKDDQPYEVTSCLSAGGAFELYVDGQIVARGHATGAHPLDLTIPAGKAFPLAGRPPLRFYGPGLQLEWSPGWAGLILGPMDGGTNRCEDIRFFPGVVPPSPAR